MSYILEGLKKLEQKRQREGAPSLLTTQGDTTPVSPKRSFWLYAVAGTILFNGIIVLFLVWTGPAQRVGQATGIQAPVARPDLASEEKKKPGDSGTAPIKKERPAPVVNEEVTPLHNDHGIPGAKSQPSPPPVRKDNFEALPSGSSSNVKPFDPARESADTSPPASKPIALKGRLLRIQELPLDLKAGLPPLKMTVHSFNDQPQSRFAIIDNRTIREGQFLTPTVKVEQITAGGVILRYQGYRFLLAINENF